MSKPFDSTMRELFELEPAAWLEFLGIPVPDPSQVEVIDSNLSTLTAEADKVVRVGGPEPWIVHTEFLSGRDLAYPDQALWYHTLLRRRHRVPVWTVVVLLRPVADGPELTGVYEVDFPGRGQTLWFRYDVVRIWLEPPEKLLNGGLSVLPLAPVSHVAPEQLPAVLTAVAERLRNEAAPELKGLLWMSTEILMGLRYNKDLVYDLTKEMTTMILGIRGIEESTVYQDIFAKGEAKGRAEGRAEGEAQGRTEGEAQGRAEGALEEDRSILLGLGRDKLGPPEERVEAQIAAIRERERLRQLLHRLLKVSSWDELLASDGPSE